MTEYGTTEPEIEVAGITLPARLLDGYQVHRAALARNLSVLSLPRQVHLVGDRATVPAQFSFTHGVPESSDLAAVTFAQDHRLKRALLHRAGVPAPEGASFSWKSIARAEAYAERIGYPVVVRDGVGENPVRAVGGICSGNELRKTFSELRRRDKADRTPGSNPRIAGYATTRLTYTYDDEGNEVAPLKSRMLVEKEIPGRTVRAFVIGDDLVAAVELDNNHAAGVRNVTEEMSGADAQLYARALSAIPGLAFATIDAVESPEPIPEHGSRLLITSISERPRIETYVSADDSLGDRLGDSLLAYEAAHAGLELPEVHGTITRMVEIGGLRNAEHVAAELPPIAERYGVTLAVEHVDQVTGDIRAGAKGRPDVLAALAELLMAGYLCDDKAAAINVSKGDHVA